MMPESKTKQFRNKKGKNQQPIRFHPDGTGCQVTALTPPLHTAPLHRKTPQTPSSWVFLQVLDSQDKPVTPQLPLPARPWENSSMSELPSAFCSRTPGQTRLEFMNCFAGLAELKLTGWKYLTDITHAAFQTPSSPPSLPS